MSRLSSPHHAVGAQAVAQDDDVGEMLEHPLLPLPVQPVDGVGNQRPQLLRHIVQPLGRQVISTV